MRPKGSAEELERRRRQAVKLMQEGESPHAIAKPAKLDNNNKQITMTIMDFIAVVYQLVKERVWIYPPIIPELENDCGFFKNRIFYSYLPCVLAVE